MCRSDGVDVATGAAAQREESSLGGFYLDPAAPKPIPLSRIATREAELKGVLAILGFKGLFARDCRQDLNYTSLRWLQLFEGLDLQHGSMASAAGLGT